MTKQDCARKVCEALAPMKDWEHQSARVWRSAAEQLASIELKGRLLSAAAAQSSSQSMAFRTSRAAATPKPRSKPGTP